MVAIRIGYGDLRNTACFDGGKKRGNNGCARENELGKGGLGNRLETVPMRFIDEVSGLLIECYAGPEEKGNVRMEEKR